MSATKTKNAPKFDIAKFDIGVVVPKPQPAAPARKRKRKAGYYVGLLLVRYGYGTPKWQGITDAFREEFRLISGCKGSYSPTPADYYGDHVLDALDGMEAGRREVAEASAT